MANENIRQVTLGQAKQYLQSIISEHLPLMLWGPPGVGKSAIIKELAKENKMELIDLRLSLLNPVDLRGLPVVNRDKGIAEWLPPEFLPRPGAKPGILFLDEMNAALVSVQVAAYQLVLDRAIGNYKLPDNWRIIAAGNRETDKAAVNRMPSPLANRLLHLEINADIKEWNAWATKEQVDERVMGFLNNNPDVLSTLPEKDEKAYPTPRSWEFVSRILKANKGIEEEEFRPLIEGAIGTGAAVEFYAWLPQFLEMPDVQGILKGEITEVPKRADVCTSLANALVANLEDKYLENFLNYTFLMPEEFSVLAVTQAVKSGKGWDEKITQLPRWEEWAEKHADLIK